MKILAIDIALNNIGLVKATFNGSLFIDEVGIIQNKTKKQKNQKQNHYDVDTCKHIFYSIHYWLNDVDTIMVELPHGSQSSRAMVSYAVSMAIVGYISTIIPTVYYISPLEVKRHVGSNTASKNDVIAYVNDLFPNTLPPHKNKAEHIADALVTLLVGLKREFNYENRIK